MFETMELEERRLEHEVRGEEDDLLRAQELERMDAEEQERMDAEELGRMDAEELRAEAFRSIVRDSDECLARLREILPTSPELLGLEGRLLAVRRTAERGFGDVESIRVSRATLERVGTSVGAAARSAAVAGVGPALRGPAREESWWKRRWDNGDLFKIFAAIEFLVIVVDLIVLPQARPIVHAHDYCLLAQPSIPGSSTTWAPWTFPGALPCGVASTGPATFWLHLFGPPGSVVPGVSSFRVELGGASLAPSSDDSVSIRFHDVSSGAVVARLPATNVQRQVTEEGYVKSFSFGDAPSVAFAPLSALGSAPGLLTACAAGLVYLGSTAVTLEGVSTSGDTVTPPGDPKLSALLLGLSFFPVGVSPEYNSNPPYLDGRIASISGPNEIPGEAPFAPLALPLLEEAWSNVAYSFSSAALSHLSAARSVRFTVRTPASFSAGSAAPGAGPTLVFSTGEVWRGRLLSYLELASVEANVDGLDLTQRLVGFEFPVPLGASVSSTSAQVVFPAGWFSFASSDADFIVWMTAEGDFPTAPFRLLAVSGTSPTPVAFVAKTDPSRSLSLSLRVRR